LSDPDRLQRLERAARRCLELLEGGRTDAAWSELAAALRGSGGSGGPGGPDALGAALSDVELEQAFEAAHPVADEVIDADRVAQQAMREVDLEGVEAPATFATGTMAELLERQGDAEGARRIRASLADRETRAPAASLRRRDRERIVATLERWLSNVRRGASA
jgi:hypothetical protein